MSIKYNPMNILITSAIKLTTEQINTLNTSHNLYFLENEDKFEVDEISKDWVEGIVCNFFFLHNRIEEYPNLRFIQLTSVGLERVPLPEIKTRDIHVFNIRDAYAVPMAEWAVGKTLEIYKKSRIFYRNQSENKWEKIRTTLELYNKKVLILGYGHVGRNIAKRLRGFDVNVVGVKRSPIVDEYCDCFMTLGTIDNIISEIDIVYLCLPTSDETKNILNADRLKSMKDTATIINLARGSLIDEAALIKLLKSGKFLGVTLDVFEKEPLPKTSELWSFENVYITPHNSFVAEGNCQRIFEELMENLDNEK